jgi:PAS domain S-box-containing protein
VAGPRKKNPKTRKPASESGWMQNHYAALIGQITEYAIFTMDRHGIPVDWNGGVGHVLGYAREEFIGKAILNDIFTPEDVEAGIPQRELETAATHGSSMNDRWMVRKGGIQFFAMGITTRILDDDGQLVGFAKMLRDQTDQRLVEERLRQSEEHLRMALSAADMGTWLYRVNEEQIILDDHLVKMLGLQESHHAYKLEQLAQVVHPEDRPWLAKEIKRSLTNGGEIRSEFRLALQEQESRWVKIQGKLLSNDPIAPMVIAGACLDITDRRRSEMALRDADRRKDEFLATLAHELRNPLAPIRNGLRILELAEDDRELRQSTQEMMDRQVGHMVRLIDDLLDVSRITRGSIELRKEQVELRFILEQALETSRPLIQKSGHQLSVLLPPDPAMVNADTTRLAQVFNNLLNNAAKYTEPGGNISITMRLEGGEAIVSVADDGMGIPPDLLNEVFDMFAQVDRSLERSQTGLGIGLSIVKRLVHMHGGRVEAYSEGLGRGSRFMVFLPLAEQTGQLPSPQVPYEPVQKKGRVVYHRILIVDDNYDAACTLASIFKVLGHQVRTATNGHDAIEQAASFRPVLIIMDIGMPGMSGYEACRIIREHPWGAEPMIVALTGWGKEEDRMRSEEAGFDRHLVKPMEGTLVAQLLRELEFRQNGGENDRDMTGSDP